MRSFGTCFAAGLLLGVTINFVGPLAETLWQSGAGIPPAAAQTTDAVQTVDRTNKSDRLRNVVTLPKRVAPPAGSPDGTIVSNEPNRSAKPIPVGCDPAFSPLSASARALIYPNRCIS
jgi:hypothetical protein